MWMSKRFQISTISPKISSNFSLLSFKDIEILYNEDENDVQFQQPEPGSKPKPKRAPSILQRTRSSINDHRNAAARIPKCLVDVDSHGGVVFYFTSLRVVRRTFQDCWTVRSILRGYKIPIDERDLSMDGKFIYELQEIMGKKISLPAVFIGGKYIGGVDEITRLHENGELRKVMIDASPRGGGGATVDCDLCGGLRFVVCEECDGSHKIYFQKLGGFRSCMACNADGLVRCSSCFSPSIRCR